jgi:hypothetical protein
MKKLHTALFPFVLAAAPIAAQQQVGPKESPYLGVQTELKDPSDPKSGLIVAYTWPLSAARQMGFQIGDEVRTFNDILITDPEAFAREVRKENVNAKVRFQIRRAGQDLKIEGRVGSFDKTMKAYQEMVRTELKGKPLPRLPGALWWSSEGKKWEEKPDALSALKGKITVVMSFDDCDQCREKRYQELLREQRVHAEKATPVVFAGIFFDERPKKTGKDANLKTATELVTALPPTMPIAVAFYPGDKPSPTDRDTQVLLHTHGTVILDPAGNVEYIQIVGFPESEFGAALQKSILAIAGKPEDKKSEAAPPSSK